MTALIMAELAQCKNAKNLHQILSRVTVSNNDIRDHFVYYGSVSSAQIIHKYGYDLMFSKFILLKYSCKYETPELVKMLFQLESINMDYALQRAATNPPVLKWLRERVNEQTSDQQVRSYISVHQNKKRLELGVLIAPICIFSVVLLHFYFMKS